MSNASLDSSRATQAPFPPGRYSDLVAEGLIRLASPTTSDIARITRYGALGEESPLDPLLGAREAEDR